MISDQSKESSLLESKDYFLVKHPNRVKQLGEVFTPTELVLEILGQLPDQVWDDGKTYLDPTCGNGQFLAAVLIIKKDFGHQNPLETIYGVDIMQDNIDECRQRLIDIAGDTINNWEIVKNNIRCEDGLKYDYSFSKEITLAEELKKNCLSPIKEKKKKKKIIDTVTDSPLFG
jgi:dipeptidyl aminopeptidase/acylaminoacyl peptidase